MEIRRKWQKREESLDSSMKNASLVEQPVHPAPVPLWSSAASPQTKTESEMKFEWFDTGTDFPG